MKEGFEDIVAGGWERSLDVDVLSRLNSCTDVMNEWGRKLSHMYKDAIEECRAELERLGGSIQNAQVARYEEVRNIMRSLGFKKRHFGSKGRKFIGSRKVTHGSKLIEQHQTSLLILQF